MDTDNFSAALLGVCCTIASTVFTMLRFIFTGFAYLFLRIRDGTVTVSTVIGLLCFIFGGSAILAYLVLVCCQNLAFIIQLGVILGLVNSVNDRLHEFIENSVLGPSPDPVLVRLTCIM